MTPSGSTAATAGGLSVSIESACLARELLGNSASQSGKNEVWNLVRPMPPSYLRRV